MRQMPLNILAKIKIPIKTAMKTAAAIIKNIVLKKGTAKKSSATAIKIIKKIEQQLSIL